MMVYCAISGDPSTERRRQRLPSNLLTRADPSPSANRVKVFSGRLKEFDQRAERQSQYEKLFKRPENFHERRMSGMPSDTQGALQRTLPAVRYAHDPARIYSISIINPRSTRKRTLETLPVSAGTRLAGVSLIH